MTPRNQVYTIAKLLVLQEARRAIDDIQHTTGCGIKDAPDDTATVLWCRIKTLSRELHADHGRLALLAKTFGESL